MASTIELSGGSLDAIRIELCPAYLRGEAYLTLRDGNAAARFVNAWKCAAAPGGKLLMRNL